MDKLYQVFEKQFNDEKFCFHAKNDEIAKNKLDKWTSYHDFSSNVYNIKKVNAPKYKNNIHNEWVD